MWITGLNKAGNKRKRAEMEGQLVISKKSYLVLVIVPDMAGYSDYNPYKGKVSYIKAVIIFKEI